MSAPCCHVLQLYRVFRCRTSRMTRSGLALFSSVCVFSGAALLLSAKEADLPVVPGVDLNRYQGKWFEIARLPTSFQRKCAGDVTATYTLQPDGKVGVLNTCKKRDGKLTEAKGTARLQDKKGSTAKLRVTFFWPFSGEYWIIDLDSEYTWAMVGTPNREYLWILSRTPELPAKTYNRLLARAKFLGFDTGRVRKTSQQV